MSWCATSLHGEANFFNILGANYMVSHRNENNLFKCITKVLIPTRKIPLAAFRYLFMTDCVITILPKFEFFH